MNTKFKVKNSDILVEAICFDGTWPEVLEFLGIESFDYETDYGNASLNVSLPCSHGFANVPLGYYLVRTDPKDLSILSPELFEIIFEEVK